MAGTTMAIVFCSALLKFSFSLLPYIASRKWRLNSRHYTLTAYRARIPAVPKKPGFLDSSSKPTVEHSPLKYKDNARSEARRPAIGAQALF